MTLSLKNQKILILGLGLSGRAAVRYLLKRGSSVWAVDQNREMLETHQEICSLRGLGLHALKESEITNVADFDQVVVSPGISPSHALYQAALQANLPILGEVELACRDLVNPCVAITGSNGKTTTTLLVEHALNSSGIPAKALGNVGIPLTAILDELKSERRTDVIVLELSSWQLETLRSPVIDAGVILNITPNHLDRHVTMEAYARAKFTLKDCLKPGKPLFISLQCYQDYGYLLKDCNAKLFGYSSECDLRCDKMAVKMDGSTEFLLPDPYRGRVSHDVENMMAAYALCREMGLSGEQFAASLATFKKPLHRIEFVKRMDGVSYYNDSKGTNLEAVAKAVDSMEGPTILIAGGVHKGAAYTPWLETFAQKVRCICAIGQAAAQIRNDLSCQIPVEIFGTMEEALKHASAIAKEGENVLLSPGCSSFDMFKNYEHRGDEFKRMVHALLATEGKKS